MVLSFLNSSAICRFSFSFAMISSRSSLCTSEEVKNMQALKIKKLRSTLALNMLGKKPRGEWVKPKADKYANPKYAKIQADPRLKEYYDFVLEELHKGHKMVGNKRIAKIHEKTVEAAPWIYDMYKSKKKSS